MPVEQRLTGEYPEAAGAIKQALKHGVPEERIHELMEDTYGNYEYEEARNALIQEVAEVTGMTEEEVQSESDADENSAKQEAQNTLHSDIDRTIDSLESEKQKWIDKDYKDGKLKMISFFAKKARGLMVRYIIDTNAETIDDLKQFNYEGYAFDANLSKGNTLVFTR